MQGIKGPALHSVLIADDEDIIREGLGLLVDWRGIGFEITAYAINGREVLEQARRQPFDLIVTDIRMPILDGLDMIGELRNFSPRTNIIVISGFSDFAYAKQAIKYGVKGYLLKPVDREELSQLLKVIRTELDEEKVKSRRSSNASQGRNLYDLARGNLTESETDRLGGELCLDIRCESFTVALIEIEGFRNVAEVDPQDARQAELVLRNIIERYLAERELGYCYVEDRGILGLIFLGSSACLKDGKGIPEHIKCLQIASAQTLAIRTLIAYGNEGRGIIGLSTSREQAEIALESKVLADDSSILSFESIEMKRKSIWALKWNDTELLAAIERADTKGIDSEIGALFEELGECATKTDTVYAFIGGIVLDLVKLLRKYGIEDHAETLSIPTVRSGRETKAQLKKICFDSAARIQIQAGTHHPNSAERIAAYIQEHYTEDINLKTLAGVFKMNAAYLGQIFKNSMGMTFTMYINKKRIDAAKKLLRTKNIKMLDLIERVGYRNPQHFYKQFKHMEGISVEEYRKKVL